MAGLQRLIMPAVVLAGLLAGGCASPGPRGSSPEFEALCASLDKNGDGKIAREEFLAAAKDKEQAEILFHRCDLNRDAFLTVEEASRERWRIEQTIRYIPPVLKR